MTSSQRTRHLARGYVANHPPRGDGADDRQPRLPPHARGRQDRAVAGAPIRGSRAAADAANASSSRALR
jgi:hypothetical protein